MATADIPGNCFLMVRDPMFVVSQPDAADTIHLVAHYVSGQPEGDIDALERALAAAHSEWPTVPKLAYWTRGPQAGRVPAGAEMVGVEAYCGVDETLTAFEAR